MAYPRELRTVGDHLRKRRLDLGLLQREVAATLGVRVDTIRNWEVGRNAPAQWQWPGVIRFLGYVPFSTNGTSQHRLKVYRQIHGLSQKRFAAQFGVDPSTVLNWERGRNRPSRAHWARMEGLLDGGGCLSQAQAPLPTVPPTTRPRASIVAERPPRTSEGHVSPLARAGGPGRR